MDGCAARQRPGLELGNSIMGRRNLNMASRNPYLDNSSEGQIGTEMIQPLSNPRENRIISLSTGNIQTLEDPSGFPCCYADWVSRNGSSQRKLPQTSTQSSKWVRTLQGGDYFRFKMLGIRHKIPHQMGRIPGGGQYLWTLCPPQGNGQRSTPGVPWTIPRQTMTCLR